MISYFLSSLLISLIFTFKFNFSFLISLIFLWAYFFLLYTLAKILTRNNGYKLNYPYKRFHRYFLRFHKNKSRAQMILAYQRKQKRRYNENCSIKTPTKIKCILFTSAMGKTFILLGSMLGFCYYYPLWVKAILVHYILQLIVAIGFASKIFRKS